MEYPTDADIDLLPHVDFSSPVTWNPDKMNNDDDDIAWFDAVEDNDPDALDNEQFCNVYPFVGNGPAVDEHGYAHLVDLNPRNTH